MKKNNYKRSLQVLISAICFISVLTLNAEENNTKSSIIPCDLRCEYLINPEGIDILIPRLSWILSPTDSTKYGQRQTAYRILISQSEEKLNRNTGDIWDSDWILSNQNHLIEYQGSRLSSDRSYYWKVSVKDEQGNTSEFSNTAKWSTGLLSQYDWSALWIGTDQEFDVSKVECNVIDPWLRKTVIITEKPSKATMFVASVGYHELFVNGERVSDHVLAPAVTDHSKRARYITYDIADKLVEGKNVVALWLGTSWSIFPAYITSDKPRSPIVRAQVDLYNSDMEIIDRIKTDESWKIHLSPNKLLGRWEPFNMGGEIWDANKDIKDWNKLSYDDSSWQTVAVYYPNLDMTAQMVEYNRLIKEINPVEIVDLPNGNYRVDMGVNFAGWIQIKIKGNPGSRIDFLVSERGQDEMTFNNHSAYILDNTGEGIFQNRFNYSSGRWITIKGVTEKPKFHDIKGWLVRTDYESAATFESSDDLQNWIFDKVRWTFENLSLGGYTVDCPQRERMGYGGDAHATSETGMFNYIMGAFYSKWMQDWRDVQGVEPMVGDMNNPVWARKNVTSGRVFNNGILPHTAPTYWGGGGPPWGGICVSVPWLLYRNEGDIRIIEDNIELIKGWLSFLDTHVEDNLLNRFGGQWDFLGDWLWPNATAEGMNNDTPQNICYNNCFRVYNLRIAAKLARIINKIDDAEKWEKQAEISSKAINSKYFNKSDNSYSDGSMACLAAALIADVPTAETKDAVIKRLEHEILIKRRGHIHVGITAGGLLFNLLRELGRDDLLYSMASQTDYPSWGNMRKSGATTIWEMWEKDLPGHSLLHSSYLYPAAWYIEGLSGIRRDNNCPGFKRFIIRVPELDETDLSWVKSSYRSAGGVIKSSWKRKNGHLELSVTVPPNCEALVYFPADKIINNQESFGFIQKVGLENGYVILKIAAGQYIFKN